VFFCGAVMLKAGAAISVLKSLKDSDLKQKI
jgi:hypothetical protein